MKVTFEHGGAEQKMFREFYEIAQNYFDPEETDEYWDGYIDTIHNFIVGNIPLARELAKGLSNYLENELKRKRGTQYANAEQLQ